MSKVQSHLKAAKTHSGKAVAELREAIAISALDWVTSHRSRIAAFRRKIKGTSLETALDAVLDEIKAESGTKPAARRTTTPRKTTATRRTTRTRRAA